MRMNDIHYYSYAHFVCGINKFAKFVRCAISWWGSKVAGDNAQKLLDTYSTVKYVELHKLDNITDEERREKKDYPLLASDNLELIKREIYQ